MNQVFNSFISAINYIGGHLKHNSHEIAASHWQSQDVTDQGEQAHMREVFNISHEINVGMKSLPELQRSIQPNLPWADDHFEERVRREPLNPGVQWANWPYAHSANRHRGVIDKSENKKFSHTYMERYWPKYANDTKVCHEGIYYNYGDLQDVVDLLARQPLTRQAYLPIWFPEDTGVVHHERVPCSLGYHFLYRDKTLHCTYYIRSCDFIRHYRDDLYLTVRLMLWVLQQLREKDYETWQYAYPGSLIFHCASMHMFKSDWERLFGPKAKK